MNLKDNPFTRWIKKGLQKDKQPNEDDQKKKPSLYLYMLAVLVIGVVIMMGSEFIAKQGDALSADGSLPAMKETAEDVETFGKKSSGAERTISEYERNKVTQEQTTEETDREGGKRTVTDSSRDEQIVIVRNGEKEVPIVQMTEKPEVRGVLVVAKGADNITVKKWIIEAVTRVLDIPSHKVAVMPKK